LSVVLLDEFELLELLDEEEEDDDELKEEDCHLRYG